VAGANERRIDLITADVRLLPGDGVRAVEAICARRAIPVIFITGYKEELLARVPSACVIQKPVKEEELATLCGEHSGAQFQPQKSCGQADWLNCRAPRRASPSCAGQFEIIWRPAFRGSVAPEDQPFARPMISPEPRIA
jgi:response regulator RpfG family c-di-GMP phosphodiesterase